MPDLPLTLAMNRYDRILPLGTGQVKPQGIAIEYVGFPGGVGVFYEQHKFSLYDISEMSFATFIAARARGWGYQLLPVFHNRNFKHARDILVRAESDIRGPHDLKGKTIGCPEYHQSAAVWARGILQHEFGMKPEDMVWYQDRPPEFSHNYVGASKDVNVKFKYAHKGLEQMLIDKELDAVLTSPGTYRIDRPKMHPDLTTHPLIKTRTLFPDPKAESVRYFEKTGIFPPHHVTVVRESIVEKHPWVATSLLEAFEKAKKIALDRFYRRPPSLLMFGPELLKEQRATFGDDPYAYGVKANAKAVDMFQTFCVEQGLIEKKLPLETIYPEEILLAERRLLE